MMLNSSADFSRGCQLEGLSLEGIRRVLQLENEVRALQHRVRELERAVSESMVGRDRRVFAAGSAGDVVSVKRGTRVCRSNEIMIWRPQSGR